MIVARDVLEVVIVARKFERDMRAKRGCSRFAVALPFSPSPFPTTVVSE